MAPPPSFTANTHQKSFYSVNLHSNMKIVIVGGEYRWFSNYLALQKYLSDVSPPVTIKVYESHHT
jgi:hypothetical protein